jgi:hypothetical protein
MIRLDSADDYSIIKALMWLSVVFVSEFDPAESGERAGKRVSYPNNKDNAIASTASENNKIIK